MAKLVQAIGVPHTPHFPGVAKAQGDKSMVTVLFEKVRRELEAAKPDLIIMFTSDHFVGFFYDNMPTFCVANFDKAFGPQEISRSMPLYHFKGHAEFASALLEYGINEGFDLSSSAELKIDHAVMVPLHFLTPAMDIPVVPFLIKGHVPPLPRADRCLELGKMVRRFIDQWPGNERVVIMGSASFSLEVGGPKMGYIDQEWFDFCIKTSREGDVQALVKAATPERIRAAGNTAGEVLNWIAMMGAIGDVPAKFIDPDTQPPESPRDAHAYAVWEVQP
jgi:aromatic ring-opening dioxygenase catalytic subunit (LigB family)